MEQDPEVEGLLEAQDAAWKGDRPHGGLGESGATARGYRPAVNARSDGVSRHTGRQGGDAGKAANEGNTSEGVALGGPTRRGTEQAWERRYRTAREHEGRGHRGDPVGATAEAGAEASENQVNLMIGCGMQQARSAVMEKPVEVV